MKVVTVLLWIFIVMIGICLVALPMILKFAGVSIADYITGYLSALVTYLMAIVALLTLHQNSKLVHYQCQESNNRQLQQAMGELEASIMSDFRAKGMSYTNIDDYKEAQICFYSAMSRLRETVHRVCAFMNDEQHATFNIFCVPYINDILDEMICFESLIAIIDIVVKHEHELTEEDVINILESTKVQAPMATELNALMKASLESGYDTFKQNITRFVAKLATRDNEYEENYRKGLSILRESAKPRL